MRAVAVADDAPVEDGARRGPRAAGDGGPRARRAGLDRASRTSPRPSGRVRVAVVDYGASARSCAGSPQPGAAVTVFPHDVDAGRARAARRRRCSRTARATRSRSRDEVETRRASCSAACRCSASASATSCSASRPATRRSSCRSATAARTTPCVERRTGRVLVTSQNHGFAVAPSDERRGDARLALRRHRRGLRLPRAARALGAVPPRGRPRPARRVADPRALGASWRRRLMPARRDLHSICVIGSGPIVIGQACEFDYAGCQALKVLREDGYRTIVVNSNPATIMTDPGFADRTYLEPLDLEGVADVLGRERPDALLPTLGGQTALNLARRAARGRRARRARRRADRRAASTRSAAPRTASSSARPSSRCGLQVPSSRIVTSLDELDGRRGCPRSSGRRSRSAATAAASPRRAAELRRQVERGLRESPIGQVLVEESVRGWDEFELEVIRDRADNVVIVCSIENLDPMGVHTGDSVTVAPQMTLSDEAYQELRDAAAAIVRAVGVETGGSNIQFARDRETGELRVIEMNPRVSRSSALASKATGYPIAKVAAKLAVGYTLDEIPNDLTGTTPASFEPTLDYVVVKFPRFAFEKFPGADHDARHADEVGRRGDGHRPHVPRGVREGDGEPRARHRRADAVADARRPPEGLHPWFRRELDGARREHGAAGRRSASTGASTRAPARSRRARTTSTRPGARRTRRRPTPRPQRRHPRLRPEPDRPGDRVRLLLRPRRAELPRARLRGGDGQLQPGDRLDRLRHVRPPLLRAARRRGTCSRCCEREQPDGVVHPVRRPDAAASSRARSSAPASASSARRSTRSTSPRTASASARCSRGSASAARSGGWRRPRREAVDGRRADRLPGARAAVVRARRARDAGLLRRRTTCARRWPARRRPVLVDRFLENAVEIDVDALCDGDDDLRRRGDAARRGGRRPLGRLVVRAAGAVARRRRRSARSRRSSARLGAGARRRRPAQRAARDRRRRGLRARGEPARVADGAVRVARRPASTSSTPPAGSRRARGSPTSACRPSAPPRAGAASRRRCCRSRASRAPTRCSGPRCARPAR